MKKSNIDRIFEEMEESNKLSIMIWIILLIGIITMLSIIAIL